jgi:transposase
VGKYKVVLTELEQEELNQMTNKGKHSVRSLKRAHILLMSHKGIPAAEISEQFSIDEATVYRTRRYFVEYGLEEALHDAPRSGQPRKLDANQEALLVAIACTDAPEGRSRWTLSLLGEQLLALTDLDDISPETIRQRLKEKDLKPWQKKMWCIGNMDAAFIARMESILDLYAEPSDPKRPVINFDETGKQLVAQINEPKPIKPGQVAKEDYEYERAGVTNIFMFFDRHRGWRNAKVTEQKTALDFAECMRDLVDEHYPNADVVRVVLDNFGTHNEASLYKAFSPEEARRILRRLEFHYTPKHASWLNMAEIEIGVMNQQCLDRRIPNKKQLIDELTYWQQSRNAEQASIKWMFNVDTARKKLHKAYEKLKNRQN